MRKTREVIATAYFPVPIYPSFEHDRAVKTNIELEKDVNLSLFIKRKNYKALILEASGFIKSPKSVFDGLSISYYDGRFTATGYPFGVGNKGNPIFPLRDFAHSSWPFGTKMVIKNNQAPAKTWYKGDIFGKEQPKNRVDLYTPEKRDIYRPMKVGIEFPKNIESSRKGIISLVQKGLNETMSSNLKIDGIEGPNSLQALREYNLVCGECFLSLCDSKLFFEIQT